MNSLPPPLMDMNRERSEHDLARERELEQRQHRERIMRQEEEREREHERELRERERQLRERERIGGMPAPQHSNNAGAIPLHQPVASRDRLPGAISSPGGLLATHGGPSQAGSLGAPLGPNNTFGGPLHQEPNRAAQQHNHNSASQQPQQGSQAFGGLLEHQNRGQGAAIGGPNGAPVFGGPTSGEGAARAVQQQVTFGGHLPPNHQMVGGPALAQGQQPILNDALSYLDQVKVQFVDQPDVYNRFLDIMKDFKSQAIDTPGVINRVSELFAGHPNLIQGFNTFLPPGYRIECGTGNDPNTIRVTTPMGTTVQSIPGRAIQDAGQLGPNNAYYANQRGGNWQQQPQQTVESPEVHPVFSPQSRSGIPAYGQNQASGSSYDAQAASTHQTEQRNMSHLQNAATRETGVSIPRNNAVTPTPTAQAGNVNGAANQQQAGEKRGPVEFNHAISYVNKIKNRFQDKPEIYKNFLEILQTYQRESKPIQDVYAQVTQLFDTAPDLLEDFKQFLPESAAQAKAAAKAAEDAAALANVSRTPQPHQRDHKMPPVGTFAPPSVSKESKKRSRPAQATSTVTTVAEGSGARTNLPQNNAHKRTKFTHPRNAAEDLPAVSPTLTPLLAVPLPMPPNRNASSDAEGGIAFFEKVKKYVSNKQTYAEFLKLCNLFTQDLIDANSLVFKATNYIGQNPELMESLRKIIIPQEKKEVIGNQPRSPTGRVSLSNCRGFGPSYRLLPVRERSKACSGRDELCHSVLNDDWASHPTWASEDSGFVAHRKNAFEEALHRIEEERHDYDFNIEANAKVIQLLEPLAVDILARVDQPDGLRTFQMPPALGGTSESICRRVLKKIYGNDKGAEVTQQLFESPIAVLPIVLSRLKQKDEEWRLTQREWDKVWQAQTSNMYLKSLDHMGIHVKTSDKKSFGAKYITDQLKAKHEEQRIHRSTNRLEPTSRYQQSFSYDDQDVIVDAIRLLVVYVENFGQQHNSERLQMSEFFRRVLPLFFDILNDEIVNRLSDVSRGSPEDEEELQPQDQANGRSKRHNKKADNLIRAVFNRKNQNGRSKEDSLVGSKESTPDNASTNDEDMDTPEQQDEPPVIESSSELWAQRMPKPTSLHGLPLDFADSELKADELFSRDWYSLYANQNILILFSLFETLYRRLKDLKDSEDEAAAEFKRSRTPKPAKDIGLVDIKNDFFPDGAPDGSFYSKALVFVEEFVTGEMDEMKFQDFMRKYYLMKGWQLYTIQDLLKAICRPAAVCVGSEAKDKTPDIMALFEENREKEETSYNVEINYRRQVEKYAKDTDVFVIKYYSLTRTTTTQILSRDANTFDMTDMERKERWKYYVSSFIRVEPTEGVPRDRLQKGLLSRNLRQILSDNESETDNSNTIIKKSWTIDEHLTLLIDVNSFGISYKEGTTDVAIFNYPAEATDISSPVATEARNQRFRHRMILNSPWMKNLSHGQVEKVKGDFEKWVQEGETPGSALPVTASIEEENP